MFGKLIKKRQLKTKQRVYLQDSELNQTLFQPGTHYKIETQANGIIVRLSATGNIVSRRKLKTIEKPVIDIRSKEALKVFSTADTLEVTIYEKGIEIKGYRKVIKMGSKRKQLIASAKLSAEVLQQVVGAEALYDKSSLNYSKSSILDNPLHVVSLFSGCGTMDFAFKEAGYELKFALELEKDMSYTYAKNLGNHIVCADINQYNLENIPDAHIVIGGSPCQDFSDNNFTTKKSSFKAMKSPKNRLIRKFIEVVKGTKSCLVALLENVPQILTKGKQFIEELKKQLNEFEITTFKFNATQFGSPQSRERAFIVASKIGPVHLHAPLSKIMTVGEAFANLDDSIPNQKDITISRYSTIEKMKYIKQGENFLAIPEELRPSSKQSNMYRRLSWNKPACTIVNVRKSQILHPLLDRILSVRECCRLFDLPDDFILYGSLDKMQQMIANAIPVKMVKSIAQQIRAHVKKHLSLVSM